MQIGLYFGSFNPIHVGHLIIANYLVEHTDLDKLWLVVTPHNPHKTKKSLADNYDRLHLVNLAIEDNPKIQSSTIEFGLPQPSYTIDTLTYLKEKYPNKEFVLIMGGDNLAGLPKWKNYERIIENHKIYVYQRPGSEITDLSDHPNIEVLPAPLLEISSSYIRQLIKEKKSFKYLVPDKVHDYLVANPIYNRLMKDTSSDNQ